MQIKNFEYPFIVDKEEQGVLRVFEAENIPFNVKRVFTVVNAKGGSVRGKHSHIKCNQLLCCVSGEVQLKCDDGKEVIKRNLSPDTSAVFIPSGTWTELIYIENNSVLIAFCDMPYEENDYIRDYDEFLKWRKTKL